MKNELFSARLNPHSGMAAFRSASTRMARARTETRHLERNHVIRLERNQQFKKIGVRSGILWLTSTPANGDILLGRDQTFEFQNSWPYVIEAIEAAEISLM